MKDSAQHCDLLSLLEEWVDEGDTFSRKIPNILPATGEGFVLWFNGRGHVLTEQASAILLRDSVRIGVNNLKFRIMKGSILPGHKRNMRGVLNEGSTFFGFKIPEAKATRLFFESIRASDMDEMGFSTIVLPRLIRMRGGVSCRLILRKQGNFFTIGTYIEEKSDKWLKNTGFLFVE